MAYWSMKWVENHEVLSLNPSEAIKLGEFFPSPSLGGQLSGTRDGERYQVPYGISRGVCKLDKTPQLPNKILNKLQETEIYEIKVMSHAHLTILSFIRCEEVGLSF